jgi:hypothetical protein
MATLSKGERKIRVDHMKMLGVWLKENERTQKWAAHQLGVYAGYLSNLCTGKQMASEEVCYAAGRLMGPLDMTTGKPYGPAWSPREWQDKQDQEREKRLAKLKSKLKSKMVRKLGNEPREVIKKKVAKAPRRRALNSAELDASVSLIKTLIKLQPEMTVDEVVAVTGAVIAGFAS